MGASYDVAIAGAGIVGAACAMECAAAGLKVVVVEPGPIGGGATAAGMGHVVAMDDSPAQLALTIYSRQLWIELIPELPGDTEYLPCGTFWVGADEEEMAEVRRKHALAQSSPMPYRTEVFDGRQLREAEPHLREGLTGALYVPDDSTVYPPCAARYFLERSRATLVRQAVTSISGQGLTLSDGAVLSSGITINATGSWAPELTPGIEVRKRKGHLVITDRYPGFVRHVLVELGYLKSAHSITTDSCAFNAQPRRSGQILLGSCRQYDETRTIDSAMLGRMLRRCEEYMPGLADLTGIRAWTGFRAATPDKLPLIGPCDADPRLYLATGHEGLGITTSLATGRLVADHIMGRASAIPIEPYLPGRKQEGH
jgi:glycine/D-amino acid oxidase-like deaminating enzyme